MWRLVKWILLVAAGLFAIAVAFALYAMHADQERLRAGTNPCEHECLLDSGGIEGCRKECASHPLTYGPAAQPSSR